MSTHIEDLCHEALTRFIDLVASRLQCEPDRDEILSHIHTLQNPERSARTMVANGFLRVCENGACVDCGTKWEDMAPAGSIADDDVRICDCLKLCIAEMCDACDAENRRDEAADDAYQGAKEEATA